MAILNSTPVTELESSSIIIDDSRLSSPSVSLTTNSISIGTYYRTGSSVPRWRDLIRRNQNASSSYMRTEPFMERKAHISLEASTLAKFLPGYKIVTNGNAYIVGQASPQFSTDTETYNRALAKVKKELANRSGSANMMAPLAEMRELGDLVRQVTHLTTNFASALLRARKTGNASVIHFMQDTWLGYNFAAAPLFSDIGNMGQAIASFIARRDLHVDVAGSATKRGQYTFSPSMSISAAPYGTTLKASGEANYELSYRFKGAFALNLKSANDYTLLSHLGLEFSQIPATLWELTPYSWLFDYFTNIGSYLEDTFTTPPGVTKYLIANRRYQLDQQCNFGWEVAAGNPNGITILKKKDDFSAIRYIEFERQLLSLLPHAGLYVKSFNQTAGQGIPKLLNLLSLLKVKNGNFSPFSK